MEGFSSVTEVIGILNSSKDLLQEMFTKRNDLSFRFEHALELMEEDKLNQLLLRGVIEQSGNYLSISDDIFTFLETVLGASEEINTAFINDLIASLKQNIKYFLGEEKSGKKAQYLTKAKQNLRRIGKSCYRSVVDLNRNVEQVFKTEPSFKLKKEKLTHFDQKSRDVRELMNQTEQLLREEHLFFTTALDDELSDLMHELRKQLSETAHNLIELQRQIIDYLNQVKFQTDVAQKLDQLKALKDNLVLEGQTNIRSVLQANSDVIFEAESKARIKLGLPQLDEDEVYDLIRKIHEQKLKGKKRKMQVAPPLSEEDLALSASKEIFIDTEALKNSFMASGNHLFAFIQQYEYPRQVDFEEQVLLYCQLISIYGDELEFTGEHATFEQTEYAIVYPKSL
ncbi:hypothetical protein [Persicobacter psychrovividus]|uniref:DUF3375 domain-containing protein n=1 Tax=Persicobacter psychrovividus TaxID=387638 RepID=A0ABN6LG98_9BACT|nr:hypothetical protein PEPS_43850 [Persicobacter psychrovividus]